LNELGGRCIAAARLRPTTQTSIGTTAFFRNRARLVTTGFHFERMRSDM